jgi:hypothetical protein
LDVEFSACDSIDARSQRKDPVAVHINAICSAFVAASANAGRPVRRPVDVNHNSSVAESPVLTNTSIDAGQRTARAIQGEDIRMGGGGGINSWLTPQGMIAAASVHNPDYGKMAADSIAKEVEERKLIPPTTEKIASGATGVEKLAPSKDADIGARE